MVTPKEGKLIWHNAYMSSWNLVSNITEAKTKRKSLSITTTSTIVNTSNGNGVKVYTKAKLTFLVFTMSQILSIWYTFIIF